MSRDSHVTERDCHALDKEEDIEVNIDIYNKDSKESIYNLRKEIFEHWISKKALIKHKSITENIAKAIDRALKKYDVSEICLAINRYDVMLRSEYWLNYKWSLEDFLSQKNALPDFLDEGSKWVTFREEVEKNPLILAKEDRPEASIKEAPAALKNFYNQI